MVNELESFILKRLITFPGIVGIASINFDELNTPLEEKRFADGIKITKDSKGLIVTIALILKHSINNNVVAREINIAIEDILKQKDIKLSHLKIYIRGVA